MKRLLSLVFMVFLSLQLKAQSIYFPPLAGSSWDTLSMDSLGWCRDKMDTLIDYLGTKNTKAFMLLKDGKIVVEKYYGTFTKDSVWYWASAGKTLTSLMVGIAQQENLLSIYDTTSNYLGNGWTICTTPQERRIRIWNQLTMTNGLNDTVPDNFCTIDTCMKYLADAGTRWAYHTAPYTMLDSVLEVATGLSINTYFTQKVKNLTGMTGLFIPTGFNNVYYSNARSMARFGLLMLNNAYWNTTPVLSDTAYFNQMTNTSQSFNNSYGYLWWLNGKASYMAPQSQIVFPGYLSPAAPADMIAALGKNGQLLNIVKSMNLVWLRLGDAPGVGDVPFLLNDTVWQKLNMAMCSSASISNSPTQQELRLYPNPATDNITLAASLPFTYKIADFTGKVVAAANDSKAVFNISLPNLSNGMYVVYVKYDNGFTDRKLLQVDAR